MASGLGALLFVAGCSVLEPENCTLELGWRVTPSAVQVMIGESATVTAEGLTCGGQKSLDVRMHWASDDMGVAIVDEMSGKITGVKAGVTTVRGHDSGPYGIPDVAVPVTVIP